MWGKGGALGGRGVVKKKEAAPGSPIVRALRARFINCTAVAVMQREGADEAFVCDYLNHRLQAFSLDGTHLGHNLPDRSGNRYCINLVSVAGNAVEEGAAPAAGEPPP